MFSEKLRNHQTSVNPELWNAISSKLASGTITSASGGTGMSLFSKLIIAIGSVTGVSIISIMLFTDSGSKKFNKNEEGYNQTQQTAANIQNQDTIIQLKDQQSISGENNLSKTSTDRKNNNINAEDISLEVKPLESDFSDFKKKELTKDIETLYSPQTEKEINNIQAENKEENKLVTDPRQEITNNNKEEEKQSNFSVGTLPNVFTPNKDNKNDFFLISISGIEDFSLTVLDQENKIVYTTTDPNFSWDGRDLQGNLVPRGSYVYFFTGKDSKGNPISKHSRLKISY